MKRLSKNMFYSFVSRVVILLTGIVIQQQILVTFGSSLNGLTSAISQVMSYLVLLEAGLGTASIQAMYLPMAQNDWEKTSAIMKATAMEYRKIAGVFFLLLTIVAVVLPAIVQKEVQYSVASGLTLITGGSYIASYIFGGKYKALLTADQKIYLLYIFDIITNITSCILRIIALNQGKGIIFVQLINLVCAVFKNFGFVYYVKIKYKKINYKIKPDYKAIGKRWNVLIHNLAGLIVNNTDIMILTISSSLKLVSVYSIYNMIYGQLSTIIQSTFMQSPQATFGRLFYEKKSRFEKAYVIYEVVITHLIFIICGIAIIMTLPFIRLYTLGVNDISYVDNTLPILFMIILLQNQIRTPALVVINALGKFKETQNGAILEAIINLSVSIALYLFTPLKLQGLLLGTICSYMYRSVDVIVYVYRNLLKRDIKQYLRMISIDIGTLTILILTLYFALPIEVSSYMEWIYKTLGVSVIVILAFIVTNITLNYKETKIVLKFVSNKMIGIINQKKLE